MITNFVIDNPKVINCKIKQAIILLAIKTLLPFSIYWHKSIIVVPVIMINKTLNKNESEVIIKLANVSFELFLGLKGKFIIFKI